MLAQQTEMLAQQMQMLDQQMRLLHQQKRMLAQQTEMSHPHSHLLNQQKRMLHQHFRLSRKINLMFSKRGTRSALPEAISKIFQGFHCALAGNFIVSRQGAKAQRKSSGFYELNYYFRWLLVILLTSLRLARKKSKASQIESGRRIC